MSNDSKLAFLKSDRYNSK